MISTSFIHGTCFHPPHRKINSSEVVNFDTFNYKVGKKNELFIRGENVTTNTKL